MATLDALIVELNVQVDDLFIELGARRRPGRLPRLSDSELVCLAAAQVLLGCNSERRWLRFAGARLRHLFPYLPQPPGYNKGLRAAARLLAHALRHLAGLVPYAYDALGRVTSTTDALSFVTQKTYSVVCAPAGTGDPGCFEQTLTVDGKSHQSGVLVDALGRTAYEQRYTGGGPYTLYATAKYSYDYLGELVRIVAPDGVTQTTFGYDMAGRKTSMSDPDLGSQTYSYDADGNLTQSVDARGATGTIFAGYDGLDRPLWRNTSNTPTGAYDTYSYDSTAGGSAGIGRLTGETFSAGSLSGGDAYTYDGRGQQTASTLTVGGTSYPLGSAYDDAGNVLTQSYRDGETITNSYTPEGWLSGVSTTKSGTTTTLASALAYTGVGGAFGELTAMHLGGGYDSSATYDVLDRATDLKTKRTSDGAVLLDQARTFDAAGNVSTTQTTLPAGTDNQSFCYDEQDRLTWSSAATATPPCGGSNTAGTLAAAQYTQSFTYDVLGRLATGPLGSYAYGSAAHVHAATAIGAQYTAAYDAAGNMTCRAPNTSSTCAGNPTGAQLTYNNESELSAWQNAPSSPSTTASFLYDGQGQRVAQQVTSGGTTTTTVYVGGVEEVATSGATTTTTAYYYAGGKRIGLSVNGVVSYLASDGLGSADLTLSASGSATASVLYAPYGGVRYSSGTMPGTYGFTGQRSDAVSGLDYYGSRYYDPLAGQFTSADSVLPGGGFDLWGLSRYAYVEGNPENRTDPTGNINLMVGDDNLAGGVAGPIENAFSGTYAWGGSGVTTHRGITAPYRPAYKSSPAPKRSAAQKPTPADRCGGCTDRAVKPTPKAAPPLPPVGWAAVIPMPWAAAPDLPAIGDAVGACLAVAPLCGAAIGAGLALAPHDVGGAAADDPDVYASEHPNITLALGDKKEVDAAARRNGIKDRRAFGKFIEEEKQYDPGSKNARGDYTHGELDEKARQYKDQGGQ